MVSNTSCGCDRLDTLINMDERSVQGTFPAVVSIPLWFQASRRVVPRFGSTAQRVVWPVTRRNLPDTWRDQFTPWCQHRPQRHWDDHTNTQEHKNCEEFQGARRIVAIAFREKIAELSPLSYDLTDKLVEPVPLGSQDGPSGFNVASTCITYMSQTFKRTCLQDM